MSSVVFTGKLMKAGLTVILSITLTACADGNIPSLFKGNGQGGGLFEKKPATAAKTGTIGSIKLVERDVEAPEVFQVTEKALWDGRPSIGGVWVAHPDSKQPERVIIRNKTNGKFVIGALFKRERDNPGPRLQLSSEAATALGVLAGAPTTLNVTALRRETVNVEDQARAPATPETVTTKVLAPTPTQEIKRSVLKSVNQAEAKQKPKIIPKTKAEAKTNTVTETKTATGITRTVNIGTAKPKQVTPAVTPLKAALAPVASSGLSQPYIQLGFFNVEANAKNTLKALETRKIPGKVIKATAKGKTFWRVLAGPAQTKGERAAYMTEIKKMGFNDAYLTEK
ncbi:MAG: SPOR domain-containing protein [Rhodobacterales bacterium]